MEPLTALTPDTELLTLRTGRPSAAEDGTDVRKKRVTVMTPTYNEEENVRELYQAVKDVFAGLPQYDYEHLFAAKAAVEGLTRSLAAGSGRTRYLVARPPRRSTDQTNTVTGRSRALAVEKVAAAIVCRLVFDELTRHSVLKNSTPSRGRGPVQSRLNRRVAVPHRGTTR
jgi:hypothetical protein